MKSFSKKPTKPNVPKIHKPKCSICYLKSKKNIPFKKLPSCLCNFCSDCLTSWTLSQLSQLQNYSTELIRCPSMFCSQSYLISNIVPILTPQCKGRVYDTLAKKYCQMTPDIRSCPNPKCQNYGFVAEGSCNNSLMCPECNLDWEDLSLYSGFKKMAKITGRFLRQRHEILSLIHKEILTKKCPNCRTNIAKYYGCPHINCASCKFDFCWNCNQKWKFHDISLCENMILIRIVIFLMLTVLMAYKIGVFAAFKRFCIKYGGFVTNYFTANTLTLVTLNQMWGIVESYRKRNRNRQNEEDFKIHIAFGLFFNLFSLYQTHNFWIEFYNKNLILPNILIGILECLFLLWTKSVWEWIDLVI